MPLPDNRLRYPAPRIDFEAEVGLTGQDHDNWPSAQGQARYDWFRMAFIALLANQSSYDAPTQYREGTFWYDLNTETIKVFRNGQWADLSEAIQVSPVYSLASLVQTLESILPTISPNITWSGVCNATQSASIPIPVSVQTSLSSRSKAMVYINGSLLDPRTCTILGTALVKLSGTQLVQGDRFTVTILGFDSTHYITETVAVS